MAHKRYANAIMARQDIHFEEWMDEYRDQHEGLVSKDHVGRIAKQVLRKCDPAQYLLSHATIVASVDTYEPKGAQIGRRMERGVQIESRWPDYRIKPECQDIINNNGDAWERSLLLATYRTFISAPNYLEHIQLPELSKGFIVDAIARDLGKTCYVDILVATDRKHKMLIQDILAGNINAMSMGCISLFTICNRCGNVAVDDSQLCPCVLYDGKGTRFTDEDGVDHVLAELIGHVAVPTSNQFIEASWVRNPAFRGAMRRNILNPDNQVLAVKMSDSAKIYDLRRDEMNIDGMFRAAAVRRRAQDPADEPAADKPAADKPVGEPGAEDELETLGLEDEAGGGPAEGPGAAEEPVGGEPTAEESESPIKEMLNKAKELILEELVKSLSEELVPKPEDVGTVTPGGSDVMALNDNLVRAFTDFDRKLRRTFPGAPRLVRWASRAYRTVHGGGVKGLRSAGMTPRDLIVLSWIEDAVGSRIYPPDLYRVAMSVGSPSAYPSMTSYLAACKVHLGRRLTQDEALFLSWKGQIASLSANF
jgi:hypothetical protein